MQYNEHQGSHLDEKLVEQLIEQLMSFDARLAQLESGSGNADIQRNLTGVTQRVRNYDKELRDLKDLIYQVNDRAATIITSTLLIHILPIANKALCHKCPTAETRPIRPILRA